MIEIQFISNEQIIQKTKMNYIDFCEKFNYKKHSIQNEKYITDKEIMKNIWIECFYNNYFFNHKNFRDNLKIDVIKLRIKDPKKVELGKRLAKVSKEAKLRKERERYIDFKCYIAFFVVFGELYFLYKTNKKIPILDSIILD